MAVYYLLRWIVPSALLTELKNMEFRVATLMCFVPVLIWTGISEGLRRRSAAGVPIGVFTPPQIPVEQHRDAPEAHPPDVKQ